MKVLILICMVFCHIVDDYYLQGWLASAKQKEWWKKNAPEDLYKYDYIVALFMHSFSWSFMTMVIPSIYNFIYNKNNWVESFIVGLFILNTIVHMVVDDAKANKKYINLIIDQTIHILQIFFIWFVLVSIF